jgi:stress response protein YsnF
MDVELKQETARVTRERIDEPVSDAEFEERDVDMPLHREEAVVQKQTVAKERVGLEKDVDVEKKRVREQARKERVDVDKDEDR